MLSTAQQMLQDSRSKIELIRLQIIKVAQAGSSSSSGVDGGGNPNSSTHGGQSAGTSESPYNTLFFYFIKCANYLERGVKSSIILPVASHNNSVRFSNNLSR